MSCKKLVLRILGIAFGIVLCIFCMLWTLMWLFSMPVTETVLSETVSPNGKYVAVTSSRDAGATTTRSYSLSILECVGNKRISVGNAFHSDAGFSVTWMEDQKLFVIIHDSSKRILLQNEKVGDIVIEYMHGDK